MQIKDKGDRVEIQLNNQREILPEHVNQLRYYGFTKNKTGDYFYPYESDYAKTVLKLISYLDKQSIAYTLCSRLQQMKNDSASTMQDFSNLKMHASSFKNGDLNKSNFKEFSDFVNSTIKRKLRPHQLKSAYHHYILKNAANFSVPGSGKTTTVLTVYEKMKRESAVDTLFVVGPLSSFSAWKREFRETLGDAPRTFILSGRTLSERRNVYYGDKTDNDIILTTFQTFSNDSKHISNFFANHKVFMVVDEAHYMKQVEGRWSSAIIDSGTYAKARIILTGTPCPKSYSDLFSLFDFLWGKNVAINEKEKATINESEKNKNISQAQVIIRDKLSPLFYRVRKSELGLTEPVFHEPILIQMNELERKIYDSIFKRISELSYFDSEKSTLTLLALKRGRIIRLRQVISYPKLLTTAIDDYTEDLFEDKKDLKNVIVNYDKYETAAKFSALVELISNIQKIDSKVVIWTNFIGTIKMLESELRKNGFKCDHIDGNTPVIEKEKVVLTREKIVSEFLKIGSTIDVLIANPGACAESISLHKTCHHSIYYDLSYNCAQYLQSLDRIHRVGGSENQEAHYYFLQYTNTIDGEIMANLQQKKQKMYDIVEYDSDIYKLDINAFDDEGEEAAAYNRIFKK